MYTAHTACEPKPVLNLFDFLHKMPKVVKRNRSAYSIKQKKEVVEYAKQMGRNKAASHFELDASMVGRWVKASSGWTEVNQNSKRLGSGRKPFYPESEKRLYDWIISQRKQG